MKSMPVEGENLERVVTAFRSLTLFSRLEDGHVRDLASRGELLQFESGEQVERQGEPTNGMHVILSGELRIMLSRKRGGESLEITRFGPGQALGIAAALLGGASPSTAEAVDRLTVVRIQQTVLQSMATDVPIFGFELARTLAERLSTLVDQIPVPEAAPEAAPTENIIDLLPLEFTTRHRLMPLESHGGVLTLGFVDPPSPELAERIRTFVPSMQIKAVRIDAARLDAMLSDRAARATPSKVEPVAGRDDLERLLRAMATEGGSDLHLSEGQRPRWRIDGEMREVGDAPVLGTGSVLELLSGRIPERNQAEFDKANDSDFAIELTDVARFRVNIFRDMGGVGAVLRIIPSTILTLEQLGMPAIVGDLCDVPKGLVLVTGPTGSGKSTTLAAMVDRINRSRREHVITLEDPVEFVHVSQMAMMNQREVGPHTDSFARALRAALREDPDIVLVGEMRDLETISMALETANTGHLVLATLHTATAMSTVDRIVGMFPSEEQARIRATLADVLRGVLSQSLLRRIGGGRVAALEILVSGHAVSNLIREGKTHQLASAMQTGKAAGNRLLNESLAELVTKGVVTHEEAVSKAVDKAELARRLGKPQVTG